MIEYFLLPLLGVFLAMICLYSALRSPGVIRWRLLLLSLLLYLPIIVLNGQGIGEGLGRSLVQAYANMGVLLMTLVAVPCLVVVLPSWRKLASLFLVVGFICSQAVISIVVDQKTLHENTCVLLIRAQEIELYAQAEGHYPATYNQLLARKAHATVPGCPSSVLELGGVLYSRTPTGYFLGTWGKASITDCGFWVCHYDRPSTQVICRLNDWTAFPAEIRPSFTPGQP